MSNVSHPAHYNTGKIEVIEFLEDQALEPHEWNAVKYICRAKFKGRRIEDLEKSIWYLKRKLELLRAAEENRTPTRPNAMNPQDATDISAIRAAIGKQTANLMDDAENAAAAACKHCGCGIRHHSDGFECPVSAGGRPTLYSPLK